MDPLLWKRIEELFAAARPLTGEKRLAFLKEHCEQDEDLFNQVLSLLDIDTKPGLLDSKITLTAVRISQVIADRFRIVRLLGAGGMGDVYEAEDLRLHDRVALKITHPEIASDTGIVERFKREILLAKRVTHANVCRIHDLGFDRSENGTEMLFLTMQFLDGETLASRIARGPLSEVEASPLIHDMADGLSAAHQAEVIHRDFKSGNVMLVPAGDRTRAVITDFGLALAVQGVECMSLTRADPVGTVGYMAPEQIKGEKLAPTADIYAFGVVIYEMVTGRRPFTGDSNLAIALKHVNEEPLPPRALAPHLSSHWEKSILHCLRKLPEERFRSVADVKASFAAPLVEPVATGMEVPQPVFDTNGLKIIEQCLAQSVGPIACHLVARASKAARSMEDLCQTLAQTAVPASERALFLSGCHRRLGNGLQFEPKAGTPHSSASHSPSSSKTTWDQALLDELKGDLAIHLGPIAKVIVDRAASKAKTEDELRQLVASEITSEAERKTFLAGRQR